jgi:hypothetical protein
MEATSEFAQLQLRFVDQVQWRYELIRPLVLFEERPTPPEAIRQRAHAMAAGLTDRIWTMDDLLSFRVPPQCVWPSTPKCQH